MAQERMSRVATFATPSVVLAAILTAIGTFSGSNDHELRTYLIVLAIILVAAAIIFGYVVARALREWNVATAAFVLAVLAAVSIVLFWLGLPALLAGGAALLALEALQRARGDAPRDWRPRAALALAALTVVAAIVLAIAD